MIMYVFFPTLSFVLLGILSGSPAVYSYLVKRSTNTDHRHVSQSKVSESLVDNPIYNKILLYHLHKQHNQVQDRRILQDDKLRLKRVIEEESETPVCEEGQFMCTMEQECLDIWYRCDGYPNCLNGTDELDCENHTCMEGYVKCKNNYQCTHQWNLCNYQVDCDDGSDESPEACESCPDQNVLCPLNPNQCYNPQWTCDRVTDCVNGEDELNCYYYYCPKGWRKCADGVQCYNEIYRCDGRSFCRDGSDEFDCPKGKFNLSAYRMKTDWKLCLEGFTTPCADYSACYQLKQRCDGYKACADGSDEWNCEEFECPGGSVKCRDNLQCTPHSWLCDGRDHCHDGSDEDQCVPETTTSSPLAESESTKKPKDHLNPSEDSVSSENHQGKKKIVQDCNGVKDTTPEGSGDVTV